MFFITLSVAQAILGIAFIISSNYKGEAYNLTLPDVL